MAKKKVVCSFDYEHDNNYYNLLKAWNSNPNIDFGFNDCTPKEIQTESVSVVKQVLSTKIGEANYMVAIIGEHSCETHKDCKEIGYNNWQSYEIAKNNEKGNGLVVVQIDSRCRIPEEAYVVGAKFVRSFNEEEINKALQLLANK